MKLHIFTSLLALSILLINLPVSITKTTATGYYGTILHETMITHPYYPFGLALLFPTLAYGAVWFWGWVEKR